MYGCRQLSGNKYSPQILSEQRLGKKKKMVSLIFQCFVKFLWGRADIYLIHCIYLFSFWSVWNSEVFFFHPLAKKKKKDMYVCVYCHSTNPICFNPDPTFLKWKIADFTAYGAKPIITQLFSFILPTEEQWM
jgi:hypothetical protein